jgi:hypothetical protein
MLGVVIMSIRTNLETPATRASTVTLLTSCAVAVVLIVTLLLSLPVISVGAAGSLAGWLLVLLAIAIVVIVMSSVTLTRRLNS